jgi:hypothetical protein
MSDDGKGSGWVLLGMLVLMVLFPGAAERTEERMFGRQPPS